MMEECKGMVYEERLKRLRLTSLETRRIRADLLEVYKILHGFEGLNEKDFFDRHHGSGAKAASAGGIRTRGNSLKLYKLRFKGDNGKFCFGNRIINNWNGLPDSVVLAENVDDFKGRLDKFMSYKWGLK